MDGLTRYIAEHGQSLTRLCLKLCHNAHEAEDLYQETWCRVLAKLPLYDRAKPFEPWLYTVCVNTYRNIRKKADGRQTVPLETDVAGTAPLFDEEHDWTRQIVNELEEKYRLVIILHYFKDYSVSELASILRIPQGTVKSRLYKARKILKGRFEDEEPRA